MRTVLIAGFAGMLLIFFLTTVDAVRLLEQLRIENRILRESVLERTNRLASIRSSILLTQTYVGDLLLESDKRRSPVYVAKVQQVWLQMRSDLGNYHPDALEEQVLVKRLEDVLDQHWQSLSRAMILLSVDDGQDHSVYRDQIVPLRVSMDEIAAQLRSLDTRQAASTELQIQSAFERLGARLSTMLLIALGAALLLAAACLFYILRVERQNRRRYMETLQARTALTQLSARLVEAQESERRTISRELHDQVGQTLNALLMDTANLAKRIPQEDAASRRYLDNIRTFADSSVNAIRDIALLLRPSMLDDLGLIPALEWQARELSRRSGINVKIVAGDVPDSLPDETRTCIYRVVQEALQNVSRHSGAKSAVVTVRRENGALHLSVEDDGRGFEPARTRGLGMLGMEERIKQLGGSFQIDSAAGKGTSVRVTLPILVPEMATE